jgi:RNA polymerase sigma factor (sigma-70 family)
MASEAAHLLAKHLRNLSSAARVECLSDRELLQRFAATRDEDAFAALVRRHGPMVLCVGRRVLHNGHDAEDVLQATFLVLSRKAGSLRRLESVGCFLHGVAYRLALKARTQFARQRLREGNAAVEKCAEDPLAELTVREAQAILDEELARLPENYRAALVLCCLEGKTRDEAARQLGWSTKLVKSRLEQGRERLRNRLSRRGLTLSAALVATLFTEEVAASVLPATLIRATVEATRTGLSNGISASVALLVQSALGGMITMKAKILVGLLLLMGLLAAGMGAFTLSQEDEKKAENPSAANRRETQESKAQHPSRTDQYGDPLPAGAVARLGTQRWRHGNQVTAVAFSPDGKLLASGSWDEALHLWNAKSGKLLRILLQGQFPGMVNGIFFTPDGKQLVSCGGRVGDNSARVWDLATGKELRRWPIPGGWKLALSPDGKLLAGIGNPGRNRDSIALWDITTGKQVRDLPFEGVQDSVIALAFSPDGKQLVSGGGSTLRLFDVVKGKQLRTFGEGERINSVSFSPDGKTVAVARWKTPITLWDLGTFERIRQLDIEAGARVAFSHDGKTLAGCKYGFTKIILWDAATGKKLREFPGQHYQVWDLAFSPDEKTLAVGNGDSQVRLWEVSTGKEISSVGDHRDGINFLSFIEGGQGIASASGLGIVCQWEIATSRLKRRFQEDGIHCFCGDLSPDGRTLALGDDAGVHLFEWSTGKQLRLLKGHKLQVWAAVFSPKGDVLASSANMDQHIILWDVATGKERRRIQTAFLHDLRSLVWSPDGKILASVGAMAVDNVPGLVDTVCLWDPSTGKRIGEWSLRQRKDIPLGQRLFRILFSPDGTLLAAADGDNTVVVWEVASGRMRARLSGSQREIRALAFSPDGRMLASGGMDRTIRLWELSTGKERRRYEGHLGAVTKLAFSADGLTLASTSGDTSVLLWSIRGYDPHGKQPDLTLAPSQMEKLWNDLASEDASRAWQATCTLVKAPKQAVPWLKEHLKPPSPAELDCIKRLLADLDSDQFDVRLQAARKLEKLGGQAEPAMRNALERSPSLEARRQIKQLMEKLEWPIQTTAAMREFRSLEVLEYIGTDEARAVLRSLAEGIPETRLAREAKAALERLAHQSTTPR